MAYVTHNPKSKAALKRLLSAGIKVRAYQVGPWGWDRKSDSRVTLEGPHNPEPHRWYATARTDSDGMIVPGSVK